MPSCAFPKCFNNTRNQSKNSGVTFHSFPTDVAFCKKWVDIVRAARRDEDWISNKYSRVCSDHFAPREIYVTINGRRKINKTALPHCQDRGSGPTPSTYYKLLSAGALMTSSTGDIKVEVYSDSDDPLIVPRAASPSGLSDIGSADIEEALDTPYVLRLKKQLQEEIEKVTERDETIGDQQEKLKLKDEKIERLEKSNQRLMGKVATLKRLLITMKRKWLAMKRKEPHPTVE